MGLYLTGLSEDDIDDLDFKIPEVDLEVPDIDMGGEGGMNLSINCYCQCRIFCQSGDMYELKLTRINL